MALTVALVAASVPILIHLFNRRRYHIVDWAAMRFLLAATKRTTRRVRLENWILLALRVLILLLIVMAMTAVQPWAEPYWQKILPSEVTPTPVGRTHRVIVLDASFSMATRVGDDTRFAIAKRHAEQIIRESATGDGFSVIVLGDQAETLVPGPASRPEPIIKAIRQVTLPHGTADVSGGLGLVSDLLTRSPPHFDQRKVVFLTDLQRASWVIPDDTDDPIGRSWAQIRERARPIFVDVAGTDRDNLAVTGLTFNAPIALRGVRSTVTATIHNYALTDQADVRVRLLVGSSPESLQPVSDRTLSIKAGEGIPVTFPVAFDNMGEQIVQVRLDHDALSLDDIRSLVVDVQSEVPVLLVDGKPAAEELARGSGWLQRALNPFPATVRVPAYPATPRVLSLGDFADATLGELTGSDLVFLCDLPTISDSEAQRLDQFLKRGGTLVIGLGPNAARNLDEYNLRLGQDGVDLLPGQLVEVVQTPEDAGFNLFGDADAFTRPPLEAFRADAARSALTSARFWSYVRVDSSEPRGNRTLLSFVQPNPGPDGGMPEPALIERPHHRGRVILFTSSFDADWSSWPLSPSFPAFIQELFRYGVDRSGKRERQVGEPIQAYVPGTWAGLQTNVTRPDGTQIESSISFEVGAGRLLIENTSISGLYTAEVEAGRRNLIFAVNVPSSGTGPTSESNLIRVPANELRDDSVVVINDPDDIPEVQLDPIRGESPAQTRMVPRGPDVARVALWCLWGLLLFELLLGWRLGAARFGPMSSAAPPPRGVLLPGVLAGGPLLLLVGLLTVVIMGFVYGEFLGFIPGSWRTVAEGWIGVPDTAPGEGTTWSPATEYLAVPSRIPDLWIGATAGLVGLMAILCFYGLEGTALGRFRGLVAPVLLRGGLLALLMLVLLPQLHLRFQRESWPDVVLLVDTSASMSKADEYADPKVRAIAQNLASSTNLSELHRLRLAQALLNQGAPNWLTELINRREVHLHVYTMDDQFRPLAEASDIPSAEGAIEKVMTLTPDGPASRITPAVEAILKQFRGRSLSAMVLITDGIPCAGRGEVPLELERAGRSSGREGVPLFLVGVGDARQPFDMILSDLRAEEVVRVSDTLIMEARVTAQGGTAEEVPAEVPVILSVKMGDRWVELSRTRVSVSRSGEPSKVRLEYVPTEVGEKRLRIKIPRQPGEYQTANNRIDRTVLVTEAKRLRVLMVEGYPRYEYRFLKSMLGRLRERGEEATVDLRVLQLDADRDAGFQERFPPLATFPTAEELRKDYDAVILGDVDPGKLPDGPANLQALAEFVREKGGGLLVIAGPISGPGVFHETPLADVLPIVAEGASEPPPDPIVDTYRPRLTAVGQAHPVFRFAGDDAASAAIWAGLPEMRWFASGYRRKRSAEVLLLHPDRAAEPRPETSERSRELHPLALQQFAGAGRVLFFGFDETWLWRQDSGEDIYEAFWLRCIRMLGSGQLGRTELRLDRQSVYLEGEPIRITVRFPDDRAPPTEGIEVRVLAERFEPGVSPLEPDRAPEEVQTLRLEAIEGSRATYETVLTRTPVGAYRFRLTEPPPTEGSPPVAEAYVEPRPGELDRLAMNRDEMERAASLSGGRFFTIAEFDEVIDALPQGERIPLNEPRDPWPIWNNAIVFLLALSMFVGEWVLRKRQNLA